MATRILGDNMEVPGQISVGLAPSSASHVVRHDDARLRFTGAYYILALDAQAAAPIDLDPITVGSDFYLPYKVVALNATADHSAATIGLYTAAGGAGTELVAAVALATLTAAGKFQALTLAALTDIVTATTLYPRLTVASASAGTFDLAIWIHDLSDIAP